jgi:pyruvate kinase
MSALFVAHHLPVKAIAALTESGSTALWLSRMNCPVPIYALTTQAQTCYRVTLFRNVTPILFSYQGDNREEALNEAESVLLAAGAVERGDIILLTVGEPMGHSGGTNTLKIITVGEARH